MTARDFCKLNGLAQLGQYAMAVRWKADAVAQWSTTGVGVKQLRDAGRLDRLDGSPICSASSRCNGTGCPCRSCDRLSFDQLEYRLVVRWWWWWMEITRMWLSTMMRRLLTQGGLQWPVGIVVATGGAAVDTAMTTEVTAGTGAIDEEKRAWMPRAFCRSMNQFRQQDCRKTSAGAGVLLVGREKLSGSKPVE